jgi:hypothetical protein
MTTDIRPTSYDARYANPEGYRGTLNDVLTQLRAEPGRIRYPRALAKRTARAELLQFLRVTPSTGTAKPEDDSVEYGVPEAPNEGFYSLAYALKYFPCNFLPAAQFDRLEALSVSRRAIFYVMYLQHGYSVDRALAKAEAYPFPVPEL